MHLVRYRHRLFSGLSAIVFFFFFGSAAMPSFANGPADSIVVLYVTFPDGFYEIGTGVFVDHDGLILTADQRVSSLITMV